jgi:hypothetical protein
MSADSKASQTTVSSTLPISESLVSRIIVAPVLFISFLVSLFLIDKQTSGTVFSHNSDEHSSSPDASESPQPSKDSKEYYHSNQRKLARQEVEDAFQMRSKVIAGFVMLSGALVAIVGWAGSKLVHTLAGRNV